MPTSPEILSFMVAGEWRSAGRELEPVFNPATGDTIAMLPHATIKDLDDALDGAEQGFEVWRKVSAFDRSKVLRGAADILRRGVSEIAARMTLEQGKPLAEARVETIVAADTFDWFAEEGRRAYGRVIPARYPGQRQITIRQPVGPVAAFAPWNFPAMGPARKIAAALAAGCSCIIKPSEEVPMTAIAIAKALEEAGLPKGVLSLVFGSPSQISTHLIASPIIRKITFTGSTAVGKELAGLAAQGAKRATMELGGHAPVLVFDDVDVDQVAQMAAMGKYRNAGQVCISPTRFYVMEPVLERFTQAFANVAKKLAVGNGLDESKQMGPVANPRRLQAMGQLIGDAVSHGAKVEAGGDRIGNQGNFWSPTVLSNVNSESNIMNLEPFGPVAVINPMSGLDDAIAQANRLPYGLAAYAFTRSNSNIIALGEGVDAGMIGINTLLVSSPEVPFGGVKESGYGHEGGIEGLDAFLHTKSISEM
ncbi:NAD-dependent succinate-semialdehyde dehydrogenase [Microvirga antarctica]|uniref:NAD-dependent succinate-semialdehyde dehydrogenase n=1 Tax=Microvirga antarctica TaxID=2819233 RepID=UPI001B3075B5|nr:NAD-dependent succinate-semialdehyde dehydrogenase [Microvirga antarctica]